MKLVRGVLTLAAASAFVARAPPAPRSIARSSATDDWTVALLRSPPETVGLGSSESPDMPSVERLLREVGGASELEARLRKAFGRGFRSYVLARAGSGGASAADAPDAIGCAQLGRLAVVSTKSARSTR